MVYAEMEFKDVKEETILFSLQYRIDAAIDSTDNEFRK